MNTNLKDFSKKVFSPPHSKDSEMMVLGSMLTNINKLNSAINILEANDFYFLEHQIIFKILKLSYAQDRPIDVHLTTEELKRINKLDIIGGPAYLISLAQFAGTSAYVEEYANIVKSKSILRQMIAASQQIENKAKEEPSNVLEALDEAQNLFFKISQEKGLQAGVLLSDILSGIGKESQKPYLTKLQDKQEQFRVKGPSGIKFSGIATHFVDLDKIINGVNNSNLMILAARPAMGKTALALNIAENICFKNNLPVGIFSLEMTAEQLLHRIICSQAEVESQKIHLGDLSGTEFQKIVTVVGNMQQHTMLIDDQPGLKITDLKSRARRMKEAHEIKFLIIDYLQLLSGSGSFRTQENRQNEISEISRTLKTLARELDIPILCLSQLSRKVEDRANHRPMMSDLRESGCLHPETLIFDISSQKNYTMKFLAENPSLLPLNILAFNDKSNSIESFLMTKVFSSGIKQTFELITESGLSILATSNHPFKTNEGWKALGKLSLGEEIFILKDKEHKTYCLEKIISIEKNVICEVFDATVPEVHNFFANGICVHNSIEQDSDIVMFLLRREYYDPHDKPGLAELIIAKNRHGSIGNVTLTFEKELARFRNYTHVSPTI